MFKDKYRVIGVEILSAKVATFRSSSTSLDIEIETVQEGKKGIEMFAM